MCLSETIVHLSDVHCGLDFVLEQERTADLENQAPEEFLAKKIVYDVTVELGKNPSFIVISGDLTQSGKPKEFKMVGRFIDFLIDGFAKQPSIKMTREHVLIVPGNHDIYFPTNQAAYDSAVEQIDPERCPEKLDTFSDFSSSFYSSDGHHDVYDFDRGFQTFRFPDKRIAFVGMDSCRKVSHLFDKAPGWIYNTDINFAAAELDAEDAFSHRLAILHHNPKSISDYSQKVQMDFLQSASQNLKAFYAGGVYILMHGHRHINTVSPLVDSYSSSSKQLISVGSGTIGSSRYKISGEANRYQVVDLVLNKENQAVRVFPRMLDLVSGGSNKIGIGRFVPDSTSDLNDVEISLPKAPVSAAEPVACSKRRSGHKNP